MKKFLIVTLVVGGAISLGYQKLTPEKVLEVAYKQQDPKRKAQLVYYAARFQLYKDRNQEVLDILDPYLENDPQNAYRSHMLFRLGQANENLRNFQRARELFALYLEENPNGEHANIARSKGEILKDYK